MSEPSHVVVFGAGGFVGAATVRALQARGALVVPIATPRIPAVSPSRAEDVLRGLDGDIDELARRLRGADCVINAAGLAEAASGDESALTAANGIVPGYLARATSAAGVPRFVQVSSAAVQGRTDILDASPSVAPFSPYSRSKALGEQLARSCHTGAVIYRPPGVHGPTRRATRLLARIARSRLSSVARPGSSPSPQALLENVADAISFLATIDKQPPAFVAHPSEGLTVAGVLALLGGRQPHEVPRRLAKTAAAALNAGGALVPRVAASARRLEMMWFGQQQAPSWLTEAGWSPPASHEDWLRLGGLLAEEKTPPNPGTATEEKR